MLFTCQNASNLFVGEKRNAALVGGITSVGVKMSAFVLGVDNNIR